MHRFLLKETEIADSQGGVHAWQMHRRLPHHRLLMPKKIGEIEDLHQGELLFLSFSFYRFFFSFLLSLPLMNTTQELLLCRNEGPNS